MASSKEKPPTSSDETEGSTGNTRRQDVEWLASLSEPELDLLISLKQMAIKRARSAGCKDLANKFDLRMLRALGAVLLEYMKENIRNTPMFPNSDETLASLSGCRLATPGQENAMPLTCEEDIKALTSATPRRKRMWEGLGEEWASQSKRQKTKETGM